MWNKLTEEQKSEYKKYCDAKYGIAVVFCETGEPMYMDESGRMIDTSLIMRLLFGACEN